ncbi:MAG: dihydrolipoyl dehydrogenase [Eubacteriales bacterium]|nr:dihydrolipoyl dehydrogenase [Eubacteriales bacterium]
MVYDLIVLGGGPAGYVAAERAGHAGFKVALAEERELGGVCLNEGCIPTKTMLYSAKLHDGVKHGEKYGVTAEKLVMDHKKVVARKAKVVKSLVGGVKTSMRANNVAVFTGHAEITGKITEGYTVKAGGDTLTGVRLLIATGSSPSMPPIPGLKEGYEKGFVLTNREILDLTEVPGRLAVVGGGVIGLEMASYFNSAGAQVQVVEMLDHIAGENDQDLVAILKADFEKKGISFALSAKVTAIEENGVRYEKDGQSHFLQADKVLMSIGRRPNIRGIGLESIGVYTQRGAVVTDATMLTNVPNVYAAGDVNGISMLAHTAHREGEVAVNNMLGKKDLMRYEAIPAVLYTNPELATVGETEATATAKGLPFKAVQLSMRYAGRYQAENEGGRGIAKLLVRTDTQQVIGMQALSNYASEFIIAATSNIELGANLETIKKIVFPHPTVSEIIREAVFQYE